MIKPQIIGLTLNFRDASRTRRCVDSLLSEGARYVVVWDNSDDDGNSAGILANEWTDDQRLILLVSPANLGFSAAVNRGVAWIRGRFGDVWVALINNDAIFLPRGLHLLSGALSQNSDAMIAYPDIDHGGTVIGSVYYQRGLGLLSASRIFDSAPHASGCAMLLVLNRLIIPLFDETFFMYGEDAELGWRLVHTTGAMLHVPQVLVSHEGSASSGMGSEFYESRMVAAHLLLARKLAQGSVQYMALLFGRFLALTARASLRAWRYRSVMPLRALSRGWCLSHGDDPLLARARLAIKENQVCVLDSKESKASFSASWAASTDIPPIQGTGSPGLK